MPAQQITSVSSPAGPALAGFQKQLWCVTEDTISNLWANYFDGKTWQGNYLLAGNSTLSDPPCSPALAVFNQRLWCYYVSMYNDDNNMWYTASSNGEKWDGCSELWGHTATPLSVIALADKMWGAFAVSASELYNLYYMGSTNGTDWNQNPMEGHQTLVAPSLA
ncbi:hypothetical protein GCM10011491_46810 [Brucella endophytica]|uniref:Uncharacterized protein n=1 Tax=Brucella endophytica TaxID=1963359 RepID=A0A916SSB8_9HYPH|nr:hypothetical protein [Brucella endophytica]GGB13780.1 hypothetical protein GCM10011491_46810 [Brucella endophytica]